MTADERTKRTELIISFLKRNNCYDQWRENFIANCTRRGYDPKKRIREIICTKWFIDESFVWSRTPERADFWSNKETELHNFLRREGY